MKNFIESSSKILNYSVFRVRKNHKDSIRKFLYGINKCKAVITDSYHGTVFSIIFRKPFASFFTKENLNDRFNSLGETFHIKKRFIRYNQNPDLNLLITPLNIHENLMNSLKHKSIDYLKKALNFLIFPILNKTIFIQFLT